MTVVTLNPGQVVGLAAHLLLPDGYSLAQGPFTWTSSASAVATAVVNTRWVNNQPTARIEALTIGTTTITCTSGSLNSTVTINVVSAPAPSSLVISVGIPSKGGWDGSGVNGPGYGSDPGNDPTY